MKLEIKKKIIILFTLGIFFVFSPIITGVLSFPKNTSHNCLELKDNVCISNEDLKISEKIHINNNWTDAKAAGICTGNGTYSAPYIIENLIIDGRGFGSCILIEHSTAVFMIQNCVLFNSTGQWDAGILLNYVNNGFCIDNDCSSNYYGIRLRFCYDSVIANNSLEKNIDGIYYEYGANNTISGNKIRSNNQDGIDISVGFYSQISKNSIIDNGNRGIFLVSVLCHDNNITDNLIKRNGFDFGMEGLYILDGVFNFIYHNCFVRNYLNAHDRGSNNSWDSGVMGNYWNNYTGSDENHDGIGDISYNIIGSAGSKDNFPLMKCPFSIIDDKAIFSYDLIFLIGVLSVVSFILIKKRKDVL
ncbi:MAG: nitrous oxide reductase family maturation protein NosD [Promethearchaeota archaeon]